MAKYKGAVSNGNSSSKGPGEESYSPTDVPAGGHKQVGLSGGSAHTTSPKPKASGSRPIHQKRKKLS